MANDGEYSNKIGDLIEELYKLSNETIRYGKKELGIRILNVIKNNVYLSYLLKESLLRKQELLKENKKDIQVEMVESIFELSKYTYGKTAIAFKKLISPVLTPQYEETLEYPVRVIKNEFVKNGKRTIYCPTHVFRDDIASIIISISAVLKDNVHLVCDDGTKEDLKMIEAIGLLLNGIVSFEKTNRVRKKEDPTYEDPKEGEILLQKAERILLNNGNLLLFLESTWNFLQNMLVREIPWRFIELANKLDANLVPVAIDLVNGEYLVSIGKSIDKTGDKAYDVKTLRDAMATLVWGLIELKEPLKREELEPFNEDSNEPDEIYWYKYIQEKCQGGEYDLLNEEQCAFKSYDTLDDVMAQLFGMTKHTIATNFDEYQKIKELSYKFTRLNNKLPQ